MLSQILYDFVKTFPLAVAVLDHDGIVLALSTRAETLLGLSRADAVGHDAGILRDALGGDPRSERSLRTRGGVLVEVLRSELVEGDDLVDVLVFEDATLLEHQHRDLEQAERNLHWLSTVTTAVLDQTPDAFFLKDPEGRFLLANRAAQQMFGTTAPLAGRTVRDLLPEQDARLIEESDRRLLAEERVETVDEVAHVGGQLRWLSTTKGPLRDSRGNVLGLFGTSRDVTAERHAQDALARANAELTRANTDLDQFAYVAAHDLQEPLRTIAGYLDLVRRRFADLVCPVEGCGVRRPPSIEVQHHIERAIAGAERMRQLVEDLLTYTRAGRAAILQPVDLNRTMREVMEALAGAIAEADADVTWDELPTVQGTREQLAQVMQNLVGNAIKYRRGRPRVRVSAVPAPIGWEVRVHDDGIGIAPEDLHRLFRVFSRLHGSGYPGTGIGLAICQRVVEKFGGRIWAESVPGVGSIFHFTCQG